MKGRGAEMIDREMIEEIEGDRERFFLLRSTN
jgi:hypothetical protein